MIGPFFFRLLSLDVFFFPLIAAGVWSIPNWRKKFPQPIHFREWILFFSFCLRAFNCGSMPLFDLWIFGLSILFMCIWFRFTCLIIRAAAAVGFLFISHKSNIVDQATEMNGMFTIWTTKKRERETH